MSKLQLILLGHFDCLLSSGERISLAMRKAEVLLAYLALAPRIRHPRERLINLLWSDRGEEQARNSLRQCLSSIRKSLGDAADLILQIDRTTVSLKPELIDVDALEFERLATEADFESLSTAAGLYQGEFLEGVSIRDAAGQEWLDGARARFKRQYIEILTNLGHTLLASRDYSAAIKSGEHLVEQDPLGESGWRLLMRSYFDHGDRSHALQAFKRCQQALRDELDVEPEAATLELRDRIAAGVTNPPPVPTSGAGKSSVDTPSLAGSSSLEPSVDSQVSTEHSIAVLPFDNLSGDPEQEYFSDGITDSIILNLSLFPGLNVKSRNSSFAFKQQIKSLGEISRELEVDYVVEGSIRKSGDRIRITVQLIEAASGNQIWGKRYDAEIEDLFDLEEELSRAIAATVTGQIESELQRFAIAKGATDQQSYDLLLSGTYHALRFNRQDTVIAIEQLNQCLALDPNNVRAHVRLCICHLMDYLERWTKDYQASFKLAEEHIRKALELGPELGLVQVFYGVFLTFRGELGQGARHLDKAFEINPNDPDALTTRAFNLGMQGETEASLRAAERACQLDPYHPWAEWELVVPPFLSGHYETVLETITKLRTSPVFMQIFGIASNIKLGRIDVARQALQFLLQECRASMLSMPQTLDEWLVYTLENYPFKDPRINQNIIDCLVQAGLEDEYPAQVTVTESDEHSIAVLPFDNLSHDSEQEYFSDGITESIILNLSLFPGLQVKSRSSSFAFKQQLKSLGEISKELNVDYIVEGSIRKSNDRIRITVQLIEAASGNQIWGKRYDAEIEDLFDLEEELSRAIAATVTGQIESELQRIAIAKGAVHPQAYDLLLTGIYHCNKFNRSDMAIAIDKLNQCLALDPDNLRAHATLCICHMMNWMERWIEDYGPSFKLAAEHAHKALALDPGIGYVRIAYTEYLIFNGDLAKAAIWINKTLRTNPNDADAMAYKALILELQGDFEAALEVAELGYQLDPYHPWIEWDIAESQYLCGRYEQALETIATSGNAPGFIKLYNVAANIKLDRIETAQQALRVFLQECRESMLAMPVTLEEWLRYTMDNAPFADSSINQDLIDCLVQAGLEEELESQIAPTETGEQPAILVLPFSNLSGDPEQEYFSDGITESIILNLSSVSGLKVKSRHASFAFKDSSKSIDEIAAELGVQYIVEGSIRKFSDKLRITAQLADTANNNQVWGKRFDYDLDDLFALEEELSLTIAGTVSGRVDKEARLTAMRKPAKDLKSYDYYLRASHHIHHFTVNDIKTAVELFNKCLTLDPDNAEAHACLGSTYMVQLLENYAENRTQTRELMRQHLERALELDPDNAETHAFMAEALLYDKDFERGIAHAHKAVELNPTLPDGYAMLAQHSAVNRQYDRAIEYADLSVQIDPFHPYAGWNAGEIYRTAEHYERAIETFRALPHMAVSVHAQIAACLAGLGRMEEARDEMRQYLELASEQMIAMPASEDEWYRFWSEAMPYKYQEDTDKYFDLLLQARLCDQPETGFDEIPSIAVLPFENMSGDPEQDYFSDGITTDIIATLSRFKHMRTVSRYSVLQYKDQRASIPDIVAQQNVRYILEGSVRRSADHIRVSAELIDSSDESICWSERYDRDLDDLFALQDEITMSIALAMKVQLDDGDMALHRSAGTTNIKAWELVLTAIDLQDTYIRENIIEARSMAKQAINLDPDYAYAWICLAWTHWQEVYIGWSDSIEVALDEAAEANRRAHQLNPEYCEAWSQAGLIHLMNHEAESAIEACCKAAALEPGNAEVQALTAFCYVFTGDIERGRQHNSNMLKLCPILPNWYYLIQAQIEQYSGNLDAAIPIYEKGIKVEPDSPLCRFYLIHALMEKGDTAGASRLAGEIRALDKSVSGKGLVRSLSMDKGLRDLFQAHLEKFDLY